MMVRFCHALKFSMGRLIKKSDLYCKTFRNELQIRKNEYGLDLRHISRWVD